MRLLDVQTYELHTFYGDKIPRYAILSHTWLRDDKEVTFTHLQSRTSTAWSHLPGARKIRLTCRQAAQDGCSWAWIDTCCIDKTNSSELSEAINSMFVWYKQAEVCYAYLTDIDRSRCDDFLNSRWWTRAWTLQEFISPTSVLFFDRNWQPIGTKVDTARRIAAKWNIDVETLLDPDSIYTKSVAQRMSWAANREATRAEDLAYSLLGIFQINMPMQYGEGYKAFIRLQQEIMRTTDDLSLFAWGFDPSTLVEIDSSGDAIPYIAFGHFRDSISEFGLFAPLPSKFEHCKDIVFFNQHVGNTHVEEQHGTTTLYAPMIDSRDPPSYPPKLGSFLPSKYRIVLLPCGISSSPHCLIGFVVQQQSGNSTSRFQILRKLGKTISTFLVSSEDNFKAQHTHVKIDTLAHTLQNQSAGIKEALYRKLIVKCETDQVSEFGIEGIHDWERDEENRNTLSMTYYPWPESSVSSNDGLTPQSHIPSHPELTLRFDARGFPRTLYISLQMSKKEYKVDWIAMQYHRASGWYTRNNKVFHELWSEKDWRDSHASLQMTEGKKPLLAKIETRIVYNQAISTLTISDGHNSVAGRSDSDAKDSNPRSTRVVGHLSTTDPDNGRRQTYSSGSDRSFGFSD